MKYLLSLLILIFGIQVASHSVLAAERPNILYFYVDDMGWGSIGPNGQSARKARNSPYVRTPNLNRLAAQGINFTRGYGCHVCSPARSSLQTGFHQGHTFADRNDPNNAKKAIRADDVSIGTALSSAGYATGYWGKWGYGGSKDQLNPIIENVQTLPTSHGYNDVLAELHHVRAHTFFQPTLWSAPAGHGTIGGLKLIPNSMAQYINNPDYPSTPALQNDANYPKTAYCDDAYAFAALDFIRAQGQNYNTSGQPFFGLLAVQIPHAPFAEVTALPKWDKAYADAPHFKALADQTQQWAAMVTRIDAHFGNLIAALEDPNNDGDTSDSITENTLVVFQSDNGGPSGKNNVELDANGGLSGNKGKIQEGGIRVPLIMNWPSKINEHSAFKAGTNCEMVVDVTDLLPTFCELAGASIPLGIDGVSIAPTLIGSGQQRRREYIIHEASNGQSIIRDNFKLIRAKNSPLRLYDLAVDHAEANDLSKDQPQLVKELESLLLGERVAEPKGFANTYHQWIGRDGGRTSEADNWSDYKYANAAVTYLEDRGPPQLSWIALIENDSNRDNTAHADKDLNVLGLEVRGTKNTQELLLENGVNLLGRNEIRLTANAKLTVSGGTVSSLRWIDISPHAQLKGHGSIQATVYNKGNITVMGDKQPALSINGNYRQSSDATLQLTTTGNQKPAFTVSGHANLAGELAVVLPAGYRSEAGKKMIILRAKHIEGKFSNSPGEIVTRTGVRFRVDYSKSTVTLTEK